jgi:hypothetical protein
MSPCSEIVTCTWTCDECGEIILETGKRTQRPAIFYPFWGTKGAQYGDDICFCDKACRDAFAEKKHAEYLGETWTKGKGE